MKLLTINFLTCAVKSCKTSPLSFPLHFKDAELQQTEIDYNPLFLHNILPRLDWDAIRATAAEVTPTPFRPLYLKINSFARPPIHPSIHPSPRLTKSQKKFEK